MPLPDSYLHSVRNVGAIFASIQTAGVPDRFTHEFLKQLGFTSSNDRAVIPVMKALRFLDDNGGPTDRYKRFRDSSLAGFVMAEALRDAYSDLFTIKETAYEMSSSDLQGAFKRLSGKGESATQKMATTFKSLVALGDWTASPAEVGYRQESEPAIDGQASSAAVQPGVGSLGLTLRHDIHVHLPASTDVKVYDAIFRSLRDHLG